MQWLEYVAALAAVLVLFMICAHLARLLLMKSGRNMLLKGKPSRLTLEDTLMLDSKHRLVIFTVDGDEYMALLGAESPYVVARKSKKKHKRGKAAPIEEAPDA